eukprot:jgi/Galph1/4494/GphlegSOOS_G3186.1
MLGEEYSFASIPEEQEKQVSSNHVSSELLTEVIFEWKYPASSAFVTGTFNDWSEVLSMLKVSRPEGEVWVATKSLPAGVYQYKFIIDNVWRCAPEQPKVSDERGIMNNIIHVTVRECDDKLCFCHSQQKVEPLEVHEKSFSSSSLSTISSSFQLSRNSTGIVLRYEELQPSSPAYYQRSYMHRTVDDKPFEVTVLNVREGFPSSPRNNISRVSSVDELSCPKTEKVLFQGNSSLEWSNTSVLNLETERKTPQTSLEVVQATANDPNTIAVSVRAKLSNPLFAFNSRDTHPDLLLKDSCYCVTKISASLYRSARTTCSLSVDTNYYFEIYLARNEGRGICVGLSTKELPLNCLCGTRPNSFGFYTTGHIICTVEGKPQWTKYGQEVKAGSVIGIFVRLSRSETGSDAKYSIFIDGVLQDESFSSQTYSFNGSFDIYPTVTLYSQGSMVYGLFCGDHIQHSAQLPLTDSIYGLDKKPIRIQRDSSSESLTNEVSMNVFDL